MEKLLKSEIIPEQDYIVVIETTQKIKVTYKVKAPSIELEFGLERWQ